MTVKKVSIPAESERMVSIPAESERMVSIPAESERMVSIPAGSERMASYDKNNLKITGYAFDNFSLYSLRIYVGKIGTSTVLINQSIFDKTMIPYVKKNILSFNKFAIKYKNVFYPSTINCFDDCRNLPIKKGGPTAFENNKRSCIQAIYPYKKRLSVMDWLNKINKSPNPSKFNKQAVKTLNQVLKIDKLLKKGGFISIDFNCRYLIYGPQKKIKLISFPATIVGKDKVVAKKGPRFLQHLKIVKIYKDNPNLSLIEILNSFIIRPYQNSDKWFDVNIVDLMIKKFPYFKTIVLIKEPETIKLCYMILCLFLEPDWFFETLKMTGSKWTKDINIMKNKQILTTKYIKRFIKNLK